MAHGESAPVPAAAAPAKFSFSMGKASNRRPPLPPKPKASSPDAAVEYVTSVDAKVGIVVANPKPSRGAKVVPKQEDSWRPEHRMKNIMQEADATRSTEETFETETMDAGPKPNVVYGLTVMSSRGEGESKGRERGEARPVSLKELEDQKLRDDLMNLPEEATLENYEELPVEEFAEALLRGMGWEKGKPIGRNAKVVVEPIEYVKRQGTLGLGAVPAPPKEINKKYIKPGETRPKRPEVGPAADGRARDDADSDIRNENSEKNQERYSPREEESRGRSTSENRREEERHSKRSHRHREEEDGRHSKKSHRHRDEDDDRYSKRGHRHSEGEHERYSKRSHRH